MADQYETYRDAQGRTQRRKVLKGSKPGETSINPGGLGALAEAARKKREQAKPPTSNKSMTR